MGDIEEKKPLIQKIKNKMLYYNQNELMLICGPTGSGKSFSGMRLAEEIDPTFNINRVVFTAEEFMKVLNNGMKRGQVIIWDEAGVGLPAKEWYSIQNKAINYVLQMFRHLNICVIFTTPTIGYIDSAARRLFHDYIETLKVDRKEKKVLAKFFAINFNPRLDKEYFIFPRYKGETKKLIRINKPSEELIDAYEKKKKIYSEQVRIDASKDIQFTKQKIETRRLTDEEVQIELKKYKEKGERLTLSEIQRMFGIGKDRAAFNAYAIFGKRRKGMWAKEDNITV